MMFSDFIDQIPKYKKNSLGGLTSQFKLAPKLRKEVTDEMIVKKNPKKAAVMALFYPNKEGKTTFLLTQRAQYNGTHSAQISFPGGKVDLKDANLKETALRETYEEVGVSVEDITIIRRLTDTYILPSNFLVAPFIGICNSPPTFTPNKEVDQLIEVLLENLIKEQNLTTVLMETSYMKNVNVPCFRLNDYIVWGATAMILSEIKDLIIY